MLESLRRIQVFGLCCMQGKMCLKCADEIVSKMMSAGQKLQTSTSFCESGFVLCLKVPACLASSPVNGQVIEFQLQSPLQVSGTNFQADSMALRGVATELENPKPKRSSV